MKLVGVRILSGDITIEPYYSSCYLNFTYAVITFPDRTNRKLNLISHLF